MKHIKLFAISGIALALAGCVVTSVYPYYTEKDLTFDAALKGVWVSAKPDGNNNESWTFEKNGDRDYKFTVRDSNSTNEISARLFKLKEQLFLDALATDQPGFGVPPHYLLKVAQMKPTLQYAFLDYDWLAKLLEKNPEAVRHVLVRENPGDASNTNSRVVLTADTRELQKFVLEHLQDGFGEMIEMKRPESGRKP